MATGELRKRHAEKREKQVSSRYTQGPAVFFPFWETCAGPRAREPHAQELRPAGDPTRLSLPRKILALTLPRATHVQRTCNARATVVQRNVQQHALPLLRGFQRQFLLKIIELIPPRQNRPV